MQAWKHLDLAYGEPSWLLSYVEAGRPDTLDVARLHAAATKLSGFRTLTSGEQGIGAPVAPDFRRDLYAWLDATGVPLADSNLRPHANIGVLFSQQTLDFVGCGSWAGKYPANFYGTLMILLESHIPFQVIPDSNLARIQDFEAVILPGVESLSDAQAGQIRAYVNGGGKVLATGYTSRLDEYGNARTELALSDVFGVTLTEIEEDESLVHENSWGAGYALISPEPCEQWYYWEASPEDEEPANADAAEQERLAFLELRGRLNVPPALQTSVPRSVVLLPSTSPSGNAQMAVVNLTGVSSSHAVPTSQTFTITLELPFEVASAPWVEILGTEESVTPQTQGNRVTLPISVETGGLLTVENPATAFNSFYLPLIAATSSPSQSAGLDLSGRSFFAMFKAFYPR